MKIVLIGRYGEDKIITGPEKVARYLFDQFIKLNPETEFITYYFKTTKKRRLKQFLFGSETISNNKNIYRLGILKLLIALKQRRPDIVHIVTFERFELIILLLKPILRFKLVYTIHGIYKYERKIFYKKPSLLSDLKDILLEKLLLIQSDSLTFLSPQMIKIVQNYYKLDEKKVSIIPNGVSLIELAQEKSFDLSGGVKIVFYNGLDDSRRRGLEELINLLKNEDINRLHLSVLGKSIATNFDRINFFSPMPEESLFKFLLDKHILIDNLNYMPFSTLALEAMALGLILIVSSESGISSYITNAENGFLYNASQPEEIVRILRDINSGEYNLEIISNNAVKISKELSWDKIAKKYFNLYKETLK